MGNTWKNAKRLVSMAFDKNITLHKRLLLYLCTLIFAGMGIVLLVATGFGGPLRLENQVEEELEGRLDVVAEKLGKDLEAYEGYGLQLSRDLGRSLDLYLRETGLKPDQLNDRPEELLELQKLLYSQINTTIRLGRSSGVFACIDATVNTSLPDAEDSHCGVWLRLINVSSNMILSPECILFRGNSEIARWNGLELHNRWNMEFGPEDIPDYSALMQGETESAYYWTSRRSLKGTWEDVLLLLVPIKGDGGRIYGVCGIELNKTHFKLAYPAEPKPYGTMVTVLAPLSAEQLRVDLGMLGEAEGIWIDEQESLNITKKGSLNQYRSETGAYYGVHRPLKLAGAEATVQGKQQWAVAVLVDKALCRQYLEKHKLIIMAWMLGVVLLLLALAVYLSIRFVRPILRDIEDIREGQVDGTRRYTIKELEELSEFVTRKNKQIQQGKLPEDLVSLFEQFKQGVSTLSKTEKLIFRYYVEGRQIGEIPDMLYISMSTVKKHNGNLYKKLGIASYDELMMYLDLFKRCGRLEELKKAGHVEKQQD